MNDEAFASRRWSFRRALRLAIGGLAGLAPAVLTADPFPAEIYLPSLHPGHGGDGSIGVVFTGATERERKGQAVAGAGDIDGDGLGDILISGPDNGEACYRCAAFTVFGRAAFPPSVDVIRRAHGSGGEDAFVVKTLSNPDAGGLSVSSAGDLNGDGLDDFVVGAPYTRINAPRVGAAFVLFGRESGFPPVFDLGTLLSGNGGDGSEGFALAGIDSYSLAGRSVSGGCDVNGDGLDDLVVGAPYAPGVILQDLGHVYLIFGRLSGYPAEIPLRSLLPQFGGDGSTGFVLEGFGTTSRTGDAVSCAKDTNGDGIDDLLIGATNGTPVSDPDEAYIVYGRSGGFPALLSLASLLPDNGGDGSAGSILLGMDSGDGTGSAVASVGDVNGDGLGDMMIGAYRPTPGRAFLLFGSASGFPAELELGSLLPANGGDGSQGFVAYGAQIHDGAARSLAGAGDVNDDGYEDLLIGAYDAGAAGAAYLVFGRSEFPGLIELTSLLARNGGDGSEGVVLAGDVSGQPGQAGRGVAGAGDVNGDGIDDFLVGAPVDANLDGVAYLIYGRPPSNGRGPGP
jgi:hypothetical protein